MLNLTKKPTVGYFCIATVNCIYIFNILGCNHGQCKDTGKNIHYRYFLSNKNIQVPVPDINKQFGVRKDRPNGFLYGTGVSLPQHLVECAAELPANCHKGTNQS
jgi:hypothetical protein